MKRQCKDPHLRTEQGRTESSGTLCIEKACYDDSILFALSFCWALSFLQLPRLFYVGPDADASLSERAYSSVSAVFHNMVRSSPPEMSTLSCSGESVICDNMLMRDVELSSDDHISQLLCTD